jgi:hypothetical protein
MAATSIKLAGKVTACMTRETTTFPLSSGWRRESRVLLLNSGSSSSVGGAEKDANYGAVAPLQ